MDQFEERPPYVRFEQRAVEDRQATLEAGMVQYKDVDYVLVTPAGTHDVHEEKAENWLKKQAKNAKDGRIPDSHYRHYEQMYERYKEGLELPENGIPIKNWPMITPAQVQQILQANIRTVEDLAAAPEEALVRMGMGARALKQKAEAYLQSGDAGKAAGQIHDLQLKLEEAEKAKEQQAEMIEQMSKRLAAIEEGAQQSEQKVNKDGTPRKKPGPKPKSN